MPRAQYVLECLSSLFTEKRSGLRRRKGDVTEVAPPSTNGNGNGHGNGHKPILDGLKTCRWVQRDGKTVRFSQGIGPFQGPMHVHYLPSLAIAQAFAVALLKTDEEGFPASLDPEEWAAWQEEYHRF